MRYELGEFVAQRSWRFCCQFADAGARSFVEDAPAKRCFTSKVVSF